MVDLSQFINEGIIGKVKRVRKWPADADLLHVPCEPVQEFGEELHQLIADMFTTLLKDPDGTAISANQIGVSKQVFVAHIPNIDNPDGEFRDFVCVNPTIISLSESQQYQCDEGCLSVPGYSEIRYRPQRVKISFQDAKGFEFVRTFQGFASFVVQHEMDHLNGKLFIDGLPKLKMERVKKAAKKAKRMTKKLGNSGA